MREKIGGAQIDTIMKTVVRISTELGPSVLDDLGLIAAIEWQAKQFEDSFAESDNGKEIAEDERAGPRSLNLMGMRERAHLVGGRIEITGIAGRGTVLSLRVPIND